MLVFDKQMIAARDYWKSVLSDENFFPTDVPLDRTNIENSGYTCSEYSFEEHDFEMLEERCNHDVNLIFIYALVIFNVMLRQYTRSDHLIVGIPTLGGVDSDESANLTLPLHQYVDGNLTLKELLYSTKDVVGEAYRNQYFPISSIQGRDNTHHIVLSCVPVHSRQLISKIINQHRMVINVQLVESRLRVEVHYSKQYEASSVDKMISHYVQLMRNSIEYGMECRLNQLSMLSKEERYQITDIFNTSGYKKMNTDTLTDRLNKAAAMYPERIALRSGEESITFMELMSRVDDVANVLKKSGVESEQVVGLIAEPSVQQIVGILAILKAGGAFLPLDPKLPSERISLMLRNSQVSTVLASSNEADKLREFPVESIVINDCFGVSEIGSFISSESQPSQLAYVIYTSGSSGEPKGVMMEHKSVVQHIDQFAENVVGINKQMTIALVTPFYFDVFVEDLFFGLLYGHTLVIVPDEHRLDGKQLIQLMIRNDVRMLNTTPSQARILLNAPEHLQKQLNLEMIIFGGEVLKPTLVRQLYESFGSSTLDIINLYGPTECCIDVTSHHVKEAEVKDGDNHVIPIGRSFKDTGVYILGIDFELMPIGVPGELCISGTILSRGYIGRPDLTSRTFLPSPFVTGETLYRSGDIAKWLPNGEIEYIGRVDDQVKIRGQRVELSEVEHRLLSYAKVIDAVVLSKEDELRAFLIVEGDISIKELKAHLSQSLPSYMVPSKYALMEAFPLNANGKADKKLLSLYETFVSEENFIEPITELEIRLSIIWKELLAVSKVGRDDNFFELGGHSLRAALLVSRIYSEFKKNISISQLFRFPTLRMLAELLENEKHDQRVAIQSVSNREYYPLSSAQKRLFALHQYQTFQTTYNMPGAMEMQGIVDKDRFEAAFRALIKRHEILRTSFYLHDEEPVQKVIDDPQFSIEWIEASQQDIESIASSFIRPFDLAVAPLFRVCVIRYDTYKSRVLFDMHHIISDGLTIDLFEREFIALYEGQELPKSNLQYKDYAVWENEQQDSEWYRSLESYWVNYLSGELPSGELPRDYDRIGSQTFSGDRVYFEIAPETVNKIRELSSKFGTTLFMNLLGAYYLFLRKYCGQDEFIVGTTASTRNDSDLENVMGIFINAVAIRQKIDPERTFTDFLCEVKSNVLDVFDHKEYPFDLLIDTCNIIRSPSRNPLFDTMLVMHHTDNLHSSLPDLDVESVDFENPIAKMDLTLEVVDRESVLELCFEYNAGLFSKQTVELMAQHFTNLLKDIAKDPEKSIRHYQVMNESEINLHLYELNQSDSVFPEEQLIHEIIDNQARKTPDHVAIRYGDIAIHYADLANRSSQLAYYLNRQGVGKGHIVGIILDRSIEFVICALGVLKAGGVYVPIDPNYPVERIQYILDDIQCKLLISHAPQLDLVQFDGSYLNVDSLLEITAEIQVTQGYSSPIQVKPNDLAYIIYTSGSTGQPKGAMISHKGLMNYVWWANKVYVKGEKADFPFYTSISFDLTITSIFTPLISGNSIVIYSDTPQLALERLVKENLVDVVKVTPSHLRLLLEHDFTQSRIKRFIVGGELLEMKLARDIEAHCGGNIEIYNEYGPTETVVGCMIYCLQPDTNGASVPIGKPADNVQLYILDNDLAPVPMNVTGELYISGHGVGKGYLHQDKLTGERFIDNPFRSNCTMYRTGDLVKRQFDRNIVYVGRTDEQVKVRGYRIELGEIEYHISLSDLVEQTAVVASSDNMAGNILRAYVVLKSDQPDTALSSLKEELQMKLPEYMIPDIWIIAQSLPHTANGKVDKKALLVSTPETEKKIEEREQWQDGIETELVQMWKELLGVSTISRNDNFFEIGGHSLKAIMLLSRIKKRFETDISLEEFFNNSTISHLADVIRVGEEIMLPPIECAQQLAHYPLTPAQKRIYFLQQLDNGINYNIIEGFEIRGEWNGERFESSIRSLIERHEALRTSFHFTQDGAVQVVHSANACSFNVQYLHNVDVEECVRPFDLSKAPLFRAFVLKNDDDENVKVFFDIHHIICDGISISKLVHDFGQFYKGDVQLVPLTVQPKDYAVWLDNVLHTGAMEKQESYWLQKLSGNLPILNFPTDFPRPALKSSIGDRYSFTVDAEQFSAFKKVSDEYGLTLYMSLVTVFSILLYRYTGQEDIIVGTPTSGRRHGELENVVGMFVNTTALRMNPSGSRSFADIAIDVKKDVIQMLEYQDVPFEQLVDRLRVERDTSRNPVFDVMFAMQNMDIPEADFNELQISPLEIGTTTSKFDLTLFTWEEQGALSLSFEYCTDLFKQETITRLSKHFMRLMSEITDRPKEEIRSLQMLSEEERNQLLHGFNNANNDIPRTTLHKWFREQALKMPDSTAIIEGQKVLTYAELNQKSDYVAQLLTSFQSCHNELVGLMVDRSAEMIIGMIGILKAGGGYVPLDPEYPDERIQFMIKDSGIRILITDRPVLHEGYADLRLTIINIRSLEYLDAVTYTSDAEKHMDSLAYVIYTSGSTGNPKGVKVHHGAITNTLQWRIRKYGFGPEDVVLQIPSISFDSSVEDIFSTLLSGATLLIISKEKRLDISYLSQLIEEQHVTHFLMIPSMYARLLKGHGGKLNNLKSVTVAGEALHERVVSEHFESIPHVRLVNEYGPTECSVCTTSHEIMENSEITIGQPIDNMNVYILDRDECLLPIGVIGEIFVSGIGVSKGYLNNEALTSQKFVPNPYERNTLMYRTGDLGKWNKDGMVEYIGRADNQVKIRGHRIELEEIESLLLKCDKVEHAAVVHIEDDDTYLIAFVVSRSGDIDSSSIKQYLRSHSPEYMIPERIFFVDELPYTQNGKINKQLLRQEVAKRQIGHSGDQAPAIVGEEENELLQAWRDVLKLKDIELDDNFFEIGGNSLLLMDLHQKIEGRFPGKLTISSYFTYPTIRSLAEALKQVPAALSVNDYSFQIPMEYLAANRMGGGSFDGNIDGEIHLKLEQVAEQMGAGLSDIACAFLFYLFFEYFSVKDVSICLLSEPDKIIPIRVDMSLVEEVNSLVTKISGQRKSKEDEQISLPSIQDTDLIRVLFVGDNHYSRSFASYDCDVVVQVRSNSNGITVTSTGNSKVRDTFIQEITAILTHVMTVFAEQIEISDDKED